jgi:hypothetical protein
MKERKWLTTASPHAMMGFLQYSASGRKTRLFACAAVRSLWGLLPNLRSLQAVEIGERYADGDATFAELRVAHERALGVPEMVEQGMPLSDVARSAKAAGYAAHHQELEAAFAAVLAVERCRGTRHLNEVRRWLCDLIREVFGNPFRPVALEPAWRGWNDGLVPRLARELYDQRRFDELPVLADALEDAGCDLRELLDHLRRPGGHVRGCWALDAVLDLK